MSPHPDNKKRKYEDPSPSSQHQSDTNSIMSNLPALPPPPDPSPAGGAALGGGAPAMGAAANGPTTPAMAAAAAATGKSRPKRARSKVEKKDESERLSRFHCDYCNRDLSTAVRARCAVCPDYDSCLDCFSVGAALKPHSADHAYRLIEVVHTPIYQMGWGADEEEKLIEGLEIYGVGNWEQVAKLIDSKNEYETEQHFMKVYLQSSIAPLPDPQRLVSVEKPPLADAQDELDPKALRVMHMHQQEDAAGWMPKRKDFVYEWDNDAEDIIGDMEIQDEDSKADKLLKIEVLRIYCQKLMEREKRKKFVHDRNLTDVKARQAVEKKRSKEERDFREKLKVFMCHANGEDMEKFIKGMLEERELRTHITMLREGRSQGATTVEECERMHANMLKKQMRASTSGAANTSTTATPSGPPGGEPSVLSGTSQRRARRSNGDGSASEANTHGPGTTACATTAHNGSTSLSVNTSVITMDSKDRKAPTAIREIDAALMPGAELLSSTEIAFCKSLKMTPHQYLIVKEVMIRESVRNGLRRKDARAIVKLDGVEVQKVQKIYDYLQACGWVQSGAGGSSGSGAGNGTSHGGGIAGGGGGTGGANASGRMLASANTLTWNSTKSQAERS